MSHTLTDTLEKQYYTSHECMNMMGVCYPTARKYLSIAGAHPIGRRGKDLRFRADYVIAALKLVEDARSGTKAHHWGIEKIKVMTGLGY